MSEPTPEEKLSRIEQLVEDINHDLYEDPNHMPDGIEILEELEDILGLRGNGIEIPMIQAHNIFNVSTEELDAKDKFDELDAKDKLLHLQKVLDLPVDFNYVEDEEEMRKQLGLARREENDKESK